MTGYPGKFRRGAIVHVLAGTIAAGFALTIGVISLPHPKAGMPAVPPPLEPDELRVALKRSGFGWSQLAAAGVNAAATTALVGRVRAYLDEQIEDLRTANEAYAQANAAYERLLRKVRAGLATEQERTDLATAQSARATADTTRQSLIQGLQTAAVGEGQEALSGPQASALAVMRGNGQWKMPTEYLCVAREEAQWVRLREVLAHHRIAEQQESEPDSAVHQELLTFDAHENAAAARANLANLGAAVQAAWRQAIEEP